MRYVSLVLVALLVLVHAELWFGKGGMGRVVALSAQLDAQRARNATAEHRNEQLLAEVRDLKDGLEMVEEKARHELGMVKADEIYVRVTRSPLTTPPVVPSAGPSVGPTTPIPPLAPAR